MAAGGHLGMTALSCVTLASAGLSCSLLQSLMNCTERRCKIPSIINSEYLREMARFHSHVYADILSTLSKRACFESCRPTQRVNGCADDTLFMLSEAISRSVAKYHADVKCWQQHSEN